MANSHLSTLLRLPPTLRTFLLRPVRSPPTLRNLTTRRTAQPPSPKHPSSPPKPTPPPPKATFLTRFPLTATYTLLSLLTWLPALAFIHNHIIRSMTVGGRSMYPFLNTDYQTSLSQDRVLVDMRSGPLTGEKSLHRGEIVVFRSPLKPEILAVKRVVALPGDVVRTREPYLVEEERVPVGHVWVEGEHPDGARSSVDSNTYGPVAIALLVGKVRAVYWPWEKAGWVRWQDYKGSPRITEGKVEEPVELYGF